MAHTVDFQGPHLENEVKQIRTKTHLTFKIDHFMDRIKVADYNKTKFHVRSSDYNVPYKVSDATEEKEDSTFICALGITEFEIDEDDSLNQIGVYFRRSSKTTVESHTLKISIKVRETAFVGEAIVTLEKDPPSSSAYFNFTSMARAKKLTTSTGSVIIDAYVTVIIDSDVKGSITAERPKPIKTQDQDIRTLYDDLQDLQDSDFPADFFMVSADGYNIPCIKAVLVARSPVFKTMLTSENFIEFTISRIKIKEFKSGTLKTFWSFLISDHISRHAVHDIKAEKNGDPIDEACEVKSTLTTTWRKLSAICSYLVKSMT